MHNCKNPHQGKAKKVLAVCSAGLLRSPTVAARLIIRGYNARSCGAEGAFALIPLDPVLVHWADEIIVMDEYQANMVKTVLQQPKPVHVLNLPDSYGYMDPELVVIVEEKLSEIGLV